MYYNNKRLILSIFWIVLGAVLIILCMTEKLDSSVYSGLGGGFIGVGIMQVYRNLKYRSNEEYREKIDVASNDERNRYIRMKAWSWTGYITIMALCIAAIVIVYIIGNREMGQPLFMTVCFMLVVYWVSYLVISRKQ